MSVSMYRSNVTRLSKKRADLENEVSQKNRTIISLQSDIANLIKAISKSTIPSTRNMKERQLESKGKDLVAAQKRLADLESQRAKVTKDLFSNTQNLGRAEVHEQEKRDARAKRRRAAELAHAKQVTNELERQHQLYSELADSHPVTGVAEFWAEPEPLLLAGRGSQHMLGTGETPPLQLSDTPPQPRETGDWDALFSWYYAVGRAKRMTVRKLADAVMYSHSYVQHKKNDYDDAHGTGRKKTA